MTLPVILDAGPILTFFAANQERLLISVVGPLTMPRTVHDEVEGKAARDSRFSAAAGVLRKLRGSRWLTIREDDCTDSLSAVVERTTGMPFQKRVRRLKDLGEIMVIAHAVILVEGGTDVVIVIDDGDGARLADAEAQRLERIRERDPMVGTLSLVRTVTILEVAVTRGLIADRGELRRLYGRMRDLDDGLEPIDKTGLLARRLWEGR